MRAVGPRRIGGIDPATRTFQALRIAVNREQKKLKTLLAEHRSLDYAYARAVEFGETAKRQLRQFSPSREREALMGLADYVLLRDR